MTDKEQVKGYLDADVAERFRKFVIEHEGQLYGNVSKHLQNAVEEYIDHDRLARIEGRLDEIAGIEETPSGESSEKRKKKDSLSKTTRQRFQRIASDIQSTGPTVHEVEIEEAIETHAGTSAPTLRRYKQLLENRGYIYPNPQHDDRYFTNASDFVTFVDSQTRDGNLLPEIRFDYMDRFGEDWWIEHTNADWPEAYGNRNDRTFQ